MAAPTDEQITRMAKARVAFKTHLFTYITVNLFLAALWAVDFDTPGGSGYWPVWTHLGWGLGLAIHGFTTYGPASNMLQREEEKLRRELGRT